jgi:pimeloyl-ACP methyl ester carboxylesterase
MPAPSTCPVALVHGFATTGRRTWGETGWLDLLADTGRPVVCVDLLGHGDSERPHDPEAYDALEAHALAQLPDEPVDAVGFSLGAKVLLTLASETPERFNRLVVAGVGANLFRHDDSTAVADAIAGEGDPSNPVAHHFRQLAQADGGDVEALAACLRRPNPPALTDEGLAAVTMPVLVVLGDADFAGPAEPLLERLPDARLVTLPGVDHFATPRAFGFLDAALEFLDAVPC